MKCRIDGSSTHVFGIDNIRIATVIAKLSDIFKHISQLLTNTTGNGVLKDLAVETVEVALYVVDFAP